MTSFTAKITKAVEALTAALPTTAAPIAAATTAATRSQALRKVYF